MAPKACFKCGEVKPLCGCARCTTTDGTLNTERRRMGNETNPGRRSDHPHAARSTAPAWFMFLLGVVVGLLVMRFLV
jgi:hypothetical protein